MIFAKVHSQLVKDGFKQGWPSDPQELSFAQKDAHLCGRGKCPKCRGDIEFKPYTKNDLYRSVQKCKKCSYGEEF